MASSGHGWAYLAALNTGQRRALIGEIRASDSARWAAARPAFQAAFASFADQGFIVNSGAFHPDYHTAAVPVFDRDRSIRFTLNCGAPLSTLTPKRLNEEVAPRLKRMAAQLEQAIALESGRRVNAL
jgi:DNA-binding IclR family transcriptional regulator